MFLFIKYNTLIFLDSAGRCPAYSITSSIL
nr:MAG TPA: hypothetical protein [Caudoviricetes sp.]